MTKLEKLLAQVAEEKARLAADEKAKKAAAKIQAAKQKQRQVAAAAALVVEAGLHDIPQDFLIAGLKKIATDFRTGGNHQATKPARC